MHEESELLNQLNAWARLFHRRRSLDTSKFSSITVAFSSPNSVVFLICLSLENCEALLYARMCETPQCRAAAKTAIWGTSPGAQNDRCSGRMKFAKAGWNCSSLPFFPLLLLTYATVCSTKKARIFSTDLHYLLLPAGNYLLASPRTSVLKLWLEAPSHD